MGWQWLRPLLLFFLAIFLAYQLWILGHVLLYAAGYNPGSSAFMDAHLEAMQEKNPKAKLRHRWVDYPAISSNLKRAVVASEDAKFVDHGGFDWEGMQDALEKNLKRGRIVAGGSTITQQLAKNLFLSARRSPVRKLQEAIITVELELCMSKRRILELYLNVVEWGNGIYGADAAAHHYFGTSSSRLSRSDAAFLAAILPRPRYYDRIRHQQRAIEKPKDNSFWASIFSRARQDDSPGTTAYIRHKQRVIEERMPKVRIP